MPSGKPIVLIVHAQTDPPLTELGEEAANVREALLRPGNCEPHILLAASTDRIFNELNERGERIAIVHYAGHAKGEGVVLQHRDASGSGKKLAHIAGLASGFGQLENLHFVFLNGCATRRPGSD